MCHPGSYIDSELQWSPPCRIKSCHVKLSMSSVIVGEKYETREYTPKKFKIDSLLPKGLRDLDQGERWPISFTSKQVIKIIGFL